jgi:hypothetical protein
MVGGSQVVNDFPLYWVPKTLTSQRLRSGTYVIISSAIASSKMNPMTAFDRWKIDFSNRRLERNRFNPMGGMR